MFSTDPLASTGNKIGHWYVFESLDGEFTVKNVSFDVNGSTTQIAATLSSAVDTTKTFILGSYLTNENDDDQRDATLNISLANSTDILIQRPTGALNNVNGTVYVVTFSGDESIQRGSFTYAASTNKVCYQPLTTLNITRAMANSPTILGIGAVASTAISTANSLQMLNVTNTTYICGLRGNSTAVITVGTWETVQWMFPSGLNWSDNMTNSTYVSQTVKHSVLWKSGTSLAGYIFSFDNGNGTIQNDTWVALSGNRSWINVSKDIGASVGATIRWQVYVNGTGGDLNVTGLTAGGPPLPFEYTTTEPPAACWGFDSSLKRLYIPAGCTYYIPIGSFGYVG
jgi:hypothetical protein